LKVSGVYHENDQNTHSCNPLSFPLPHSHSISLSLFLSCFHPIPIFLFLSVSDLVNGERSDE
jgi:hypothetical protein